jgi:rhomboid family GlyGly-CTERM serine protease
MLTQNEVWNRYIRDYGWPLAILAIAAVLQAAGWNEYLQYDRIALLRGEWWRAVSGHLLHLNWMHYGLNAAGLLLIWSLFGQLAPARVWWLYFLVTAIAVSLGLLWLTPTVHWYVGLSGVLHGLFVSGLLRLSRRHLRFSLAVLAIFVLKVVWEQIFGPLPGSEQTAGGPVVVAAHLYGAVAGAVTYAIAEMVNRKRQSF